MLWLYGVNILAGGLLGFSPPHITPHIYSPMSNFVCCAHGVMVGLVSNNASSFFTVPRGSFEDLASSGAGMGTWILVYLVARFFFDGGGPKLKRFLKKGWTKLRALLAKVKELAPTPAPKPVPA